jgi:hypothetical protein
MGRSRWRYWTIIGLFSVAAVALLTSSALIKSPEIFQKLAQSVGEALVVAVVVSLAVEPRLLRFFGEEIASQTFWSSFYSRAPDSYREAIKELASAERFTIYIEWRLVFDWVDDEKLKIKLSVTSNNHAENRGSRPQGLQPRLFVYESMFPELPTKFDGYTTVCEASAFSSDLIRDESVRIEHAEDGRLMVLAASEHPYFYVPPGQRYTTMTAATTYVGPTGHFPLVMVNPTLRCTVRLSGTALPELYLSIMHPDLGSVATLVEGPGRELSAKADIDVGAVSITGQAILLSWKVMPHTNT